MATAEDLLDGRVAVIGGGAGEVGEGIVRVFLRHGATVIVPSRSRDRLDRLSDAVDPEDAGRLVTLDYEGGGADGLAALRRRIAARFDDIAVAVAALGGWWEAGRLIDLAPEDWSRILEDNLTSHFLFARTFLPLLAERQGSSYILINGGAALAPEPNAGVVSVAGAAQMMLAQVLGREAGTMKTRINQIVLNSPIVTRGRTVIEPQWVTADEVGEMVAWLASDRASMVNRGTIIMEQKAPG